MIDGIWKALLILTSLGVIAISLVLVGALRELGTLIMQVGPPRHGDVGEGPEVGTEVADASLTTERPTLLVFVTPSCDLCKPVVAALATVQKAYPEVEIVPMVVGTNRREREQYAATIPLHARTDRTELFTEWSVPGTPFAVGIDRTHRVAASGIVNNLPQLESLAGSMAQRGEYIEDDTELIEVAGLRGDHGHS